MSRALWLDPGFGASGDMLLGALVDLGHEVGEWPEWEWRAGAVGAVKIGPEGTRWGGADPRRGALSIAR